MASIGQSLSEVYKKDYNPPTGKMSKFVGSFLSLFLKELRFIMPMWGVEKNFKNDETRDTLGIEFIEYNKSIQDMAHTLIETGYIVDKRTKAK
mmetsp:Transcript_12680/g.21339  ORF Transcript_12680/g.21339 Transcript_12680/m.21339 type:complete len:93 (-) Transcript_12680:110-388(-)